MPNYTGIPTAAQSPSPAPGPGAVVVISIPAGTEVRTIESITQQMKVMADGLTYTWQMPLSACFGDGSDGAATLDGTNTVSWATKVGSVYTMSRDAYLTNLTVTGAGVELKVGSSAAQTNYRLFGRGQLTTAGGAIITANGGAAANPGSTSGTSTGTGSIVGGTSGGPGGSAAGTVGVTAAFAAGGVGGAGGAGSNGAGAAGGTITNSALTMAINAGLRLYGDPKLFGFAVGAGLGTAFTGNQGYITPIMGGTGGGGGGGGSVGNGGGGGGGAGVLGIAFRNILLANGSDLRAIGGAGGSNSGTNDGGGGGGGGGLILLAYATLVVTSGSISAAVNCAGGAGGASTGTGVAGSSGAAGNYIPIQLA